MGRKLFILLLVLVCVNPVLVSQKLHFQKYSILEGLPHSSIYSMLQDSRGFLWLGTDGGGLARTDGISFETFNNANGLSGNVVRALFEDRKGRIWVGTDQGLDCYDGKEFKTFNAYPGLNNATVLTISGDTAGNILVGTWEDGLYALQLSEDTVIQHISTNEGLVGPMILDIEIDSHNKIWLSAVGGISVVDMIEGEPDVEQLLKGLHLPGDIITCSAEDPIGDIWFGTRDNGIFMIPNDPDQHTRVAVIPEFLKFLEQETIWDILWTGPGSCWIATDRLGLLKITDNKVDRIISRENGLPSNQIYRILQDYDGGMWLATLGNGILRYNGDSFKQYELNTSRIGIDVFGIIEETPDRLLVATDEGLYQVNVSNPLNIYTSKIRGSEIPSGFAFTSIEKDLNGIIWLGTDHGIYTYDGKSAVFSAYNRELFSTRINCLFVDHQGRLWIGTDNGFHFFSGSESGFRNEETGLIHNEVQAIIQDKENKIWIGTLGGLACISEIYQDFNEEEGLMNLQVHSLAEDGNGDIWIGTFGGGIYLLDQWHEPVMIRQVQGNELLSSQNIYSLIWADQQTLIAGTESGFDKLTISGDTIRQVIHFDSEDGFSEGSNNLNAVFQSSDQTIWFGTSNSLVSYDMEESFYYDSSPTAYINDLRLDYQKQDWSLEYQIPQWSKLPVNLVLPHHQNHLTFDYTAIHFNNPRDLEFSYFLEGQGQIKLWSPYAADRSVTFQGLSPGEYRMRLKSRTKLGNESKEAIFKFRIKPPFWLTGWFLASSVLILILLIFTIFRLRVRKLRKEKIRLEKIVELRTWEITQQKEQIEEQRDIVINQQQEITDSIQYAEKIQTASLPEAHTLSEYFSDHFIMLKPQHIVSGDFYWLGRKNDHLVFTAADCTGHGVPGALMSMLGVSLLNKIVNEEGIVAPAEILNELRSNILSAFHRTKDFEEGSRDGMDVALCSYDLKRKKLFFAGAMNPLYQIRKNEDTYQLIEHLPDKMPVANYAIMDPFKQKEIELQEGDTLYMFSDGFSDQFGGEKGKKFMKKRFKKMLLSHQYKTMAEQQLAFESTLSEWMKATNGSDMECRQTDDILIIGVKV